MFKITSGGGKRPDGVGLTAALTQHRQPHTPGGQVWPCRTWVPISWAKFKAPSPLSRQRFGPNPSPSRGFRSLSPPPGQ